MLVWPSPLRLYLSPRTRPLTLAPATSSKLINTMPSTVQGIAAGFQAPSHCLTLHVTHGAETTAPLSAAPLLCALLKL